MTIDKAKVEFFLSELRKRGKEITGGTPGKKRPSFELRDPEYYWGFGSFLVKQAQQVDEDQRHTWIRRQTQNIEKEILGPVTNDDGWWLLRASNTQDALVARCEAKTPQGLEATKKFLTSELNKSGITIPEELT